MYRRSGTTTPFWKKPASRLTAGLLLVLGWEVSGGCPLFPTPLVIVGAVLEAADLPGHVGASLLRTAVGFFIGCCFGFLIGVALGESKIADQVIGTPIAFLMPVPGIALAPLFIVLAGFGDRTIVPIGALAAFFPTVYNVAAGLKGVSREPVEAAMIDGASQIQVLRHVKLPLGLPVIRTGFVLSLARCWRTVVAVEFVAAANRGLGYFIWDSAEYLRTDRVFGGIVVLVLVYLVVNRIGRCF